MTQQVRWGFLGAGFVASAALAPAVHAAAGATLHAVAARDAERARRLEPATVHTDYRSLLADPAVDAVYISLSNESHLPWIIESVRAGKHVLCEKPLTLDAAECAAAFDAADAAGVLLVEATWSRWHPRYRRADELLGAGRSGQVTRVSTAFSFDGVPIGNYRLDRARGGGALLDLGPYLLAPVVDWCADTWLVANANTEVNETGADLSTSAELRGEHGVVDLHSSICQPERQSLDIVTDGLSVSWGPPAHTSWRADATLTLTERGSGDSKEWVERFPACDAYQLMVEDVSRAVRGEPFGFITSRGQSHAAATLIDLVKAAATGQHLDASAQEST